MSQVDTIKPQQIERHIGGCPRASQQIIKSWSAGLIGCDDLTVDYRIVDGERRCYLAGESVEAVEDVAVARDQAAAAVLEIAEASEPVIFEVEQPVRIGRTGLFAKSA